MLFAASLSPDGRAAALIRLAQSGKCELLTSQHAFTEASRNLELKYPHAVRRLETVVVSAVTTVAEATPEVVGIGLGLGLPLEDAPILGAALRAGADMLVTGDVRYFGHLYDDTVGGTKIVRPATALAAVLETL